MKKKGFTLIEIMIAMFVFGVLVTLSVVGVQIVQRSVRNSQRSDVINTFNIWVTRYHGDNRAYPAENSIQFTSNAIVYTPTDEIIVELNGGTVPANDTDSRGTRYCYQVDGIGSGGTFKMAAELEGSRIVEVGNADIDCDTWVVN